MTQNFIKKILEREGEEPIQVDDITLLVMSAKVHFLYYFWEGGEFDEALLEIITADNHSVFFKGEVKTKKELETIILKSLKQ